MPLQLPAMLALAVPTTTRTAHALAEKSATTQFSGSFVLYSEPFELSYGGVFAETLHNFTDEGLSLQPGSPLPADVVARYADPSVRQMAISGYYNDIVRTNADGTESR